MSVRKADPVDWKPAAIIAAALAIAFSMTLVDFFRQLWMKDHYSFFPIYLAAIGFFCYRIWQNEGPFRVAYTVAGGLRMVLPTVLLAISIWLRRPWLGAVAAVFAIRALLYLVGGRAYFKTVRLAWFALWVCIPPPFNLDLGLITKLQQFASETASLTLDWFGYRHLLTGVLLNFPKHTFEVEKACSGIHSFFASLAGVAIYSILRRRSLPRTVTLLAIAVFWVLAFNIARIVLVVVAEVDFQIPLASGLPHQLAGYAIFLLVVLCVISSDRLLMYVLPERSSVAKKKKSASIFSKLESQQVPRQRLIVACTAVSLVLAGFKLLRPEREEISTRLSGVRLTIAENALPVELSGWRRTSFEMVEREVGDFNGEVSYKWDYEKNGIKSTVAVDGPFGAWHDLAYCYAVVGWRVTSAVDKELDIPGEELVASEVQMEDTAGQYGHAVFSAFDSLGKNIPPPPVRIGATMGPRVQGGISALLAPRDSGTKNAVFCIQAFSRVPLGFSKEERDQHRRLLAMAVSHLKGQFSSSITGSGSNGATK
jgi:exosortase